jgi:serine/threonine protein phosphatase PrpC
MHVEYAQLPPPEDSADRIFITENAVIVLDGATAFVPTRVSGQTYADYLGRHLVNQLQRAPEVDLRGALAFAIRQTTASLNLQAGSSPSSTVAILRQRSNSFDVLVLGDTSIIWGNDKEQHIIADTRLDKVSFRHRDRYRSRLRAGHGYDDYHRQLLRELQQHQARRRNVACGYWICECDPAASNHAILSTIPRERVKWTIIATDGAFDPLLHLGQANWDRIALESSHGLAQILLAIRTWEKTDPNGNLFPRSKVSDDKALVACRTAGPSSVAPIAHNST